MAIVLGLHLVVVAVAVLVLASPLLVVCRFMLVSLLCYLLRWNNLLFWLCRWKLMHCWELM